MGIAENVAAGRLAREVLELAGDQQPHFYQAMIAACKERLPPEPSLAERHPPLTESEAIAFERLCHMPRGLYEGKPVGEVSCKYLIYWTEPSEFDVMLGRYVRSKTFQQRQQEED